MKASTHYTQPRRKSRTIFFLRALEIRGYRIAVARSSVLPGRRFREPPRSILRLVQQVQTHIDIEAPASLIWAILADVGRYQRWNPLIRGIHGHIRTGAQIEIRLNLPGGEEVRVRATIVYVREERELRWRDRWALPGLFSSERRFRFEQLPHGRVRLYHGERAQGILVPLLTKRRRLRGEAGFDAMNIALKQRAERASSSGAATTS